MNGGEEMVSYNRSVEFVYRLPFSLAGFHDIDFGVLEGALVPYVAQYAFRVIA